MKLALSFELSQSDYGVYLRTYSRVIRKFVGNIIQDIPKDDIWTIRFADYVHKYVPDFPSGDVIFEGENLLNALTSFFFIITVGHAVDHYNYGNLDKQEIPLRMRQAPPASKDVKMIKRSKLV